MSKKQKLLAGVCIPLATAGVAGGVAAVLLTKKTNPVAPTKGDYTLTFQVDQSSYFADGNVSPVQHVYANTALDRVPQPRVESYRGTKHLFTGWKDENNNLVPGSFKVTKDTKLTASFGDTTTGDFNTITFAQKPEQPEVQFSGNVSVAVKTGVTFVMVNRPTATWGDNYFQAWQTYDSETGTYSDISDGTVIRKNITLYPRFTEAVSMNWDVNAAAGGYLKRGSLTTRLAAGTTFDMFNQPELGNVDPTKVFSFWAKDTAGTKWLPGDYVYADSKAIAFYSDGGTIDENHHLLQFVDNETQPTIKPRFAPSNTSVLAATEKEGTKTWPTWKEVVHPTVTTDDGNYEVESWEYCDDSTTPVSWKALTDDHVFETKEKKSVTKIRPVMKLSITGVELTGPSEVLPESLTKYTVVAKGTTANPSISTKFEWGLYSNATCTEPVDASVASISDSGELTVKSLTAGVDLYVKVAASIDDTKFKVQKVTVYMPYEKSQLIWFHNGKQWMSLSQAVGLCDGTASSMKATALNAAYGVAEESIVKAADFKYKLYVGRKLTTLYGQFGYNWTGFNAPIDFGPNIKKLESSFLENCINFNQALDLSKIEEIGNDFLHGCTAFGTPSSETGKEYESLLNFGETTVLTWIGENFLGDCVNYNRDLVLPTKANYEIGDGFLYGCKKFNRDITIPANITYINDHFMYNCNGFTSTIKVDFNPGSGKMVVNPNTIASSIASADIYQIGFKVGGSYGDAFAEMFPTSNQNNAYRKINTGPTTGGVTVTSEEYTAATDILDNPADPEKLNFTIDMQAAAVINGEQTSQEQTYYFQGDRTTTSSNVLSPIFAQTSQYGTEWQVGHSDNKYLVTSYDEERETSAGHYSDPWTESEPYEFLRDQMQDFKNIPIDTTKPDCWTWNETTRKYDSPAGKFRLKAEGSIWFTGHAEFEEVEIGGKKTKRLKTLLLDNCTAGGMWSTYTITYMFKDWGTTKVSEPELGFKQFTAVGKYARSGDNTVTAPTWTQQPSTTSVSEYSDYFHHAVIIDFNNFTTDELKRRVFEVYYTKKDAPSEYQKCTSGWSGGWNYLVNKKTGATQEVSIQSLSATETNKWKISGYEGAEITFTNDDVLVFSWTASMEKGFLDQARSIGSYIKFVSAE